MSIKSTSTISRASALELYYQLEAQIKKLRGGKASYLSNKELGDELDILADELADLEDTTNFRNYLVEG